MSFVARGKTRDTGWRNHGSNDYKQGDNKFTGKIDEIILEVSPSKLSGADEKKVEDAAAAIEN